MSEPGNTTIKYSKSLFARHIFSMASTSSMHTDKSLPYIAYHDEILADLKFALDRRRIWAAG